MTRGRLRSELINPAEIEPPLFESLYAIYARHYDCISRVRFEHDLSEKTCVILIRDSESNALCGFSTQHVFRATVAAQGGDREVRALFSGDTIIDRRFWGEQELVRAWCRLAGRVRAAEPATPLYWFLISKGYRTYLYLPLFFRDFYPRHDHPNSEGAQALLDALGALKFGDCYDPSSGVIRFARSLGQLKPEFADIPPGQRANRHVEFFLARNPNYANGEELACLTEISASNMRGMAAAMLLEGEALGAWRTAARPAHAGEELLAPCGEAPHV